MIHESRARSLVAHNPEFTQTDQHLEVTPFAFYLFLLNFINSRVGRGECDRW